MHALPPYPQYLQLKRAPKDICVRVFIDNLYKAARDGSSVEETKQRADFLKSEGFRLFVYPDQGVLNARSTQPAGEPYVSPEDNTPNDSDEVRLLKLVLKCFPTYPTTIRNEFVLEEAKRDGRAKAFLWAMIQHIQRRQHV